MVFGHHSGKAPPPLDFDGHHHDPNITSPYTAGPSRDGILSPGHPDYDPMVDPNLQLRTVRTAAESIAESHRSEQRREDRKRAKKRGEQGQSILGKFGRGRSMLRRDASRKGGVGSAIANMVHDEMGHKRHASGASGTGGEGVGVAFDSAQQYKTPLQPTMDAGEEAEREAELEVAEESDEEEQDEKSGSNKVTGKRRNIYLNMPLASNEVNRKGEPLAIYPRNKVRTSKYTVVTFLPRFLFEQFRRIANIYFLGLVVLQVFPTFGATVPQIAMLPLVAILGITAIKDSIEDYRRHVLDNQVNNSAVTK